MFTTDWVDPKFPLLMAGLVLAVWIYQLVFSERVEIQAGLEWQAVKVAWLVCMLVYLMIVAQPSTQQFIYFQF